MNSASTALEIHVDDAAGVTVIRLVGSLDTATSAAALERLHALVKPQGRMLLDCAGLNYVSSAGLRVFLTTTKKLTAAGGALRMCGLNETVKEVFEISGFLTIFKVFPSSADALAGF